MLAIALLAAIASRDAAAADPSWFVAVGEGDQSLRSGSIGIASTFDPFSLSASGPWTFRGELNLAKWYVHDVRDGDRSTFTEFGATPWVRYTTSGGFFVEAGIGLTLTMPKFRDRGRVFSTAFNFGDQAGVGYRFGEGGANEVSIHAEHYSNGGIRHPNPGQNFGSIRYTRHF